MTKTKHKTLEKHYWKSGGTIELRRWADATYSVCWQIPDRGTTLEFEERYDPEGEGAPGEWQRRQNAHARALAKYNERVDSMERVNHNRKARS